MIATGILIGILATAAALFALGGLVPMAPLIGAGAMIAMLLAAIVDARISSARDRIEIAREVPEILSLGAPNRAQITVTNRTPRTMTVAVRDDPPPGFETTRRTFMLRLQPFEQRRVSYLTTPTTRGDHEFGQLHVRCLSRLRLAWWQCDVPATETVRVYPDLAQIREFDALARRGRLDDIGVRAAPMRGEGTEFESLREYVPDDSFRSIDWKATARRGAPITRQYRVERHQRVLVALDAGRMMAPRCGQMTRLDWSVNAALMLAHVAGRMGDLVGLLVFSDRIGSFVAPTHGAAQTERLLQELYAVRAEPVEPDFGAAVTFLRHRARKRAMICLFTDLVDPDVSSEALSYISSLRPQHLPMVATIPDEETARMAAARPDDVTGAYEKALAARALGERELALGRLRAQGVAVVDAAPDDLAAAVVNRYLSVKRMGML